MPESPATRAINGPELPPVRSESARLTGFISCGSALGVTSTGGLGDPDSAAARVTGEADGVGEGLDDADAGALAEGDGDGFLAAVAEADGLADGLADGFAAAAGAATGAGGGATGGGAGGAGGGAALPPSHPAPGDDWLPATWGEAGGVEEEGEEFPPNSTVAKM